MKKAARERDAGVSPAGGDAEGVRRGAVGLKREQFLFQSMNSLGIAVTGPTRVMTKNTPAEATRAKMFFAEKRY
jgi:hypothetical protein